MSWLGAAISAGGSLLGGLLGRDSAEDQQAANLANQREFAQHGIRWRVADAKAAGLHPVYALGGSGASYSPAPIIIDPVANAIAQMGQAVGAGYDRYARGTGAVAPSRRLSDPEEYLGYDYEDAMMGQDYSVGNAPSVARIGNMELGQDAFSYKAPEVMSAQTGLPQLEAGGGRPGFVEYSLTPNFKMLFPSGTSFSEALESLENPMMWPMLLKLNAEYYGAGFYRRFADSMIPGYKATVDTVSDVMSAIGAYRESMRRARENPARNRVTGKIRGVEARRPSDVPGFQGPDW